MFFGLKIPTVPSRSDSASSNVPGYTLLTQPEELEKGEAATDLLLDDHDEEPQYASTSIASRARGRFMHLIKRIAPRFHYILPSFLHPRFYEPKKLRPTAWLGTCSFHASSRHASLLRTNTDTSYTPCRRPPRHRGFFRRDPPHESPLVRLGDPQRLGHQVHGRQLARHLGPAPHHSARHLCMSNFVWEVY